MPGDFAYSKNDEVPEVSIERLANGAAAFRCSCESSIGSTTKETAKAKYSQVRTIKVCLERRTRAAFEGSNIARCVETHVRLRASAPTRLPVWCAFKRCRIGKTPIRPERTLPDAGKN